MKFKDRLKILSLAEWDFAGVGYQLSEAVNNYTEHTSTAIRWHKSALEFPYDRYRITKDEITDLWKQADVIHIHDGFSNIPSLLPKRPIVITYHGSKYRRKPNRHNKNAIINGWIQSAATLDLVELTNNKLWIPDTRIISTKSNDKFSRFTVCHAPTKRNVKSTEFVINACKIANVDLLLIENKSYQECIELKRKCHILADQFKLGYGCNAIEAWLMGIPVLAGSNNRDTLSKIKSKNNDVLPFMFCDDNVESIAKNIMQLRDNQAIYEKYARIGYDYAMLYHHPSATSKIAIDIYYLALDKFFNKDRLPVSQHTIRLDTKQLDESYSVVKYLEASYGSEDIKAPSGKVYTFSIKNNVQYVLKDDLQFFLSVTKKSKIRGSKKFSYKRLFVEVIR